MKSGKNVFTPVFAYEDILTNCAKTSKHFQRLLVFKQKKGVFCGEYSFIYLSGC